MKLQLKQKKGFVNDIYCWTNYICVSTRHSVEIYYKENVIFREFFKDPWVRSMKENEITVLDDNTITIFNWKLSKSSVYSSEVISSASRRQIYQKNKLLLVHGEEGIVPITLAPLTSCILDNGIIRKQWETLPLPIKQNQIVTEGGCIFVPNYDLNFITALDDSNGEILWQFDLTQFGPYYDDIRLDIPPQECKRKINKIYYYNDKVIVTFSFGIIALHPQTGELLWKILFNDRSPYDLIFEGNMAYAGSGFSYTIIDIERGEVFFKNNYLIKEIVVIDGKEMLKNWVSYRLICFYNRFIWSHTLYEGRWYLFKLEPSTGEIVDGCVLPGGASIAPVFIENTIYVCDMDGNLNIFDLEE